MAGLLFPEKLLAFEGLKAVSGGANMPATEARFTRGKTAVVGERVFEFLKAYEISFESAASCNSSSGGEGGRMIGKDDAMFVAVGATFEPLTLRIRGISKQSAFDSNEWQRGSR